MTKLNVIAAVSLLVALGSADALAKDRVKTPTTPVRQAEPETVNTDRGGSAAHELTFGAGVATSSFTFSTNSLTALAEFGGGNMGQVFFTIPTTTGGFIFGFAAEFKHTLFGTNANGFHVGAGAGIGNPATTFSFAMGGVAGVHFTVGDVMFQFDGGPVLTIISSTATFGMSAFGDHLGASIAYLF